MAMVTVRARGRIRVRVKVRVRGNVRARARARVRVWVRVRILGRPLFITPNELVMVQAGLNCKTKLTFLSNSPQVLGRACLVQAKG